MLSLCRELKKLARQIFGLEKAFSYKSWQANQLYMFYCIIGKVYFTDKISQCAKYLWYGLVAFEIIFSYAIGLAYLRYGERISLMVMYDIVNAVGAHTVLVVGYPMIVYWYEDSMDAMIELVDDIVSSRRFDQNAGMVDGRMVFASIMGTLFFCFMGMYSLVCFFDVVFFFDEAKVKNYLYYLYPFPTIQECGTLKYYLVLNGIATFVFELSMIELMASLSIILQWNTVCRNELICIRNEFNLEASRLNKEDAQRMNRISMVWREDFENLIRRGIKRVQRITLLINYLRGYVHMMGSFVLPVDFGYCVAVLYFITSETLPIALQLKFLACFVADIVVAFLFYWTGQNLDDMMYEVSMAVYSTPWYCSTTIRKNVYILLCQTQSGKNFTIIKVYGLLLRNLSRFVQTVLTFANFLHKFHKK